MVPPIYQVSTYEQDGVGGLRGGYEYSPLRQPHPHGAGGVPGRARGRACAASRSPRAWPPRTPCCARCAARRPRGDPRRRLRRHVPAVRQGPAALGARAHPGAAHRRRGGRARPSARAKPRSSGSRRRPTRCWASPTSRRSPRSRTPPARCSSSTTPSPRPTCSSRCRSAPTSSCTRPRSTSAATATWSAARWSRPTPRLAERLAYHQNAMGAVAGPFDSWLVLRGIKTLAVRMDRHCANAEAVVELLLAAPDGRARCSTRGCTATPATTSRRARCGTSAAWCRSGSRRRGGRVDGVRRARALHPRRVARRRRVAHRAPRPDDPRLASPAPRWRCPADLVRLSVGLETVDDLVADLEQALG